MAMTNSEKAKLFFERINASEANVSIKRRIEDVLYSEKDGKVAGGVLKKYIENVLLYKKDKAQFETLISSFDREMAKANKGDNDISSMPYDEDEKFVNLYVVKYDLFYALSAAMMYMSALNKIRETKGDLGDELFVSSVGAGNLVDFWSLNYALSLYQIQNPGKKMPEKIVYRAYDYKRWKHYLWELMPEDKGIIFPEDNFFSIQTELYLGEKKGNFKDIDTTLPVDIMLFPNSYNEIVGALGDEAFWSIIREIKNNNDGMVIVASEHIAENSFEDRVKYHFGKNTKVDVIKDDKSNNSILEMADDSYNAVKEYRLLLQGLELPEKPVFMEKKGAEAVGGTYQYYPTRNIEKNLNYSLVYLKTGTPFALFMKKLLNDLEIEKEHQHSLKSIILDLLTEDGYIKQEEGKGRTVTEKGYEYGFYTKEIQKENGEPFEKVFYDEQAQIILKATLVDALIDIKESGLISLDKKEPEKETYYHGNNISFKRTWGNHYFTEQEAEALARGEVIEIEFIDKDGGKRTTRGKIERKQGTRGNYYYAFTPAWI